METRQRIIRGIKYFKNFGKDYNAVPIRRYFPEFLKLLEEYFELNTQVQNPNVEFMENLLKT